MEAGVGGIFLKSYTCPICEGSGQFFGNYSERVDDLAHNRG